jgi:hypothetical protein
VEIIVREKMVRRGILNEEELMNTTKFWIDKIIEETRTEKVKSLNNDELGKLANIVANEILTRNLEDV